jgi:hypothetical protein
VGVGKGEGGAWLLADACWSLQLCLCVLIMACGATKLPVCSAVLFDWIEYALSRHLQQTRA